MCCFVIIVHNIQQTPNGIQIAPVELFSVLKVNQLGHFMLTSLFWLSQLWDFSKSTDWSVCEFVVMIIIRNIKAEINSPKKWKRIFLTEHTLPFGHMTNVDRHSFYLLLMEKSAGDLKVCCNMFTLLMSRTVMDIRMSHQRITCNKKLLYLLENVGSLWLILHKKCFGNVILKHVDVL